MKIQLRPSFIGDYGLQIDDLSAPKNRHLPYITIRKRSEQNCKS